MAYEAGTAFLQIVPSFSGVVQTISAEAAKWGDSAGTSFAETFKARVDAALQSLPDAKIGADTSQADEKLAGIRAELESLSGQTVGIDITDEDAKAKIDELLLRLDELGAKSPSIRVEVDAAKAEVELAAVALEADAVDGGLKDVEGSSGGASGGLSGLGASAGESLGSISPLAAGIVALGAALAPIAGLALGALATLPALIAGSVTGLGALYLGFSGIPAALSAFGKTQVPAGSGASASTALSNASAQRNAANTVQTAEEALNTARVTGARSVASAEQSLASARVSANNSVTSAENNLVNAEHTLTQAQYAEQQAQDAVVTARQNAQRQLDDYTNQLADAGLAQQQAALDVTTTKAALDAANAPGSTATDPQKAQAQLTYDTAVQHVKDLATQNQQLSQDAAAAAAAGVDGNTQVLASEHNLTVAQQATADAQTAKIGAIDAVRDAQVSGNQAIALANVKLDQARSDSLQHIADAERSLDQAQANQEDTLKRAALSTGTAATAAQTYARALASLSPAGREFVTFVTSELYPVFNGLKSAVQGAFLPLVQTGLTDLLPFFRDLSPFIIQAASGIGQTFVELAKFIGSKTGLSEIMTIFKEGNGFFSQMGGALVTMFEALTGIGAQAAPITKALADGIVGIINGFASWVSGGGFEKFLAWLTANGPSLVQDLASFIKAAVDLLIALTPIGLVIDKLIGFISDLVSWVTRTWQIFTDFLVVLGSALVAISFLVDPIQWIIAGIALLVLGVIDLIAHWKQAWDDIKTAADDAWTYLNTNLFQPISDFFTVTIPAAFDTVVTFFTGLPARLVTALGDVVSTVWGGIVATATWLDTHVWTPLKNFFTGVPGDIVTALGDVVSTIWSGLVIDATWLDTHVWTPISNFFTGLPGNIATAAKDMWKGVANAFVDVLNDIIDLWDKIKFHFPGVLGVGAFTVKLPNIPDIPHFAAGTGGSQFPGGLALVGENGPELANFGAPVQIIPNSALQGQGQSGSAPLIHADNMNFYDRTDLDALNQRVAFAQTAQRL